MQKNIRDFHMKPCYIDVDEKYFSRDLNSEMAFFISGGDIGYNYMLDRFKSKAIIGIKKEGNTIQKEYYFYKSDYKIQDVVGVFQSSYVLPIGLSYDGFTIEFYPDSLNILEIDVCDTDKAYILSQNGDLERKNIYFFFSHNEEVNIVNCIKNTIYPYTENEIKNLMQWRSYQRGDGTIVIGKKRKSEAIYFTRINYEGFITFCHEYGWGEKIYPFLKSNNHILKNYVFDISLEYSYQNRAIYIGKTAFYTLL